MSPGRNTRTGGVLERMILPALDQGGYQYQVQVDVGRRLGSGHHFVDVMAELAFATLLNVSTIDEIGVCA